MERDKVYRDRFNERHPKAKKRHSAKYWKKMRKERPWFATLCWIRSRCQPSAVYGKKGIKCLITEEELKSIWDRDNAQLLKAPSIDRINPEKDYTLDNCRYIERSENCARIRDTKYYRDKMETYRTALEKIQVDTQDPAIEKLCAKALEGIGGVGVYPCCDTSHKKGEKCPIHEKQIDEKELMEILESLFIPHEVNGFNAGYKNCACMQCRHVRKQMPRIIIAIKKLIGRNTTKD